jgi:hypothetical protein
MDFCTRCKNNITTTATPANFDLIQQYNLTHHVSEPTDRIVLNVRHHYPNCVSFDIARILQWWDVLGKFKFVLS